MASAIDNLTNEYHEHVITDFMNAVLKSGLVISTGTRHRDLPKWLRDELNEVVFKSKCQFLLPYAGFLKSKGFMVDPARMDDRLDVDLMLNIMLGYGRAIVGALPNEEGYHSTPQSKQRVIGSVDNVTFVPAESWRRHAKVV